MTYDRRGCHAASPPPTEGYELDRQAGDLELLLDHLGIDSAHVIASSAGGPIAVIFAARNARRVRSLVLQGTGLHLFPDDPVTRTIRQELATLDRAGAERAFDERPQEVAVWHDALWRRLEAEARGELEAFLAEERRLAGRAAALSRQTRVHLYVAELRNLAAYLERDVTEGARHVTAPALVLHGDRDDVVPLEWGERLARRLPNASLHVVRGAGHGLLFDDDEARGVVLAFLRGIDEGHAEPAWRSASSS